MTPARFAACPPSGAGVGPIRTELSDLQDLDCLSLGGRVTSRTGVESARNKQSRRCKKAEGHRCGSGTLRPRCGTRPPAVAVRELHATAFAACGRPAAADGAAATVGRRAAKRPGAQYLASGHDPSPALDGVVRPGRCPWAQLDRPPSSRCRGRCLAAAGRRQPPPPGRPEKKGWGGGLGADPHRGSRSGTVTAVRTPNGQGGSDSEQSRQHSGGSAESESPCGCDATVNIRTQEAIEVLAVCLYGCQFIIPVRLRRGPVGGVASWAPHRATGRRNRRALSPLMRAPVSCDPELAKTPSRRAPRRGL